MSNAGLMKQIFAGEMRLDKCSHGCQLERYKDSLKFSLTIHGVFTDTREHDASQRKTI